MRIYLVRIENEDNLHKMCILLKYIKILTFYEQIMYNQSYFTKKVQTVFLAGCCNISKVEWNIEMKKKAFKIKCLFFLNNYIHLKKTNFSNKSLYLKVR